MFWYVLSFCIGFFIGFLIAAMCAAAGWVDREAELMQEIKEKK